MTVGSLYASIKPVNDEFGSTVSTHSPSLYLSLSFSIIMTTDTLGIFSFYIPTATSIRNNVMFSSRHFTYPLCALGQQILQPSASGKQRLPA